MRIVFLVNYDLHSCMALNRLLPLLGDDQVKVISTSRVGKPDGIARALDMLKFAECDLPFHVLREVEMPSILDFETLCHRYGCPFGFIENVNLRKNRRVLSEWEPDLFVSIRHGRILKDKVIAIPKLGVLNLHSGILPDYRGVMATFHALRAGERHVGTTLHWIDTATIDTGPIIARTSFLVDPQQSYLWHTMAIYKDGCAEIAKAISQLRQGGTLSTEGQSGGNYFGIPTDEDVMDFRAKGWRLLARSDLAHIAQLRGSEPGPLSSCNTTQAP